MVVLDTARRRVRLSPGELGVASLLVVDPTHAELDEPEARECLAALEEARVASERQLSGWVAELVAVVVAPQLRIAVETFVAERVVTHSIWATPRHGVLGSPGPDGALELSPVEPVLIPWALARAVGLGARPTPARTTNFVLPARVLDQAYTLLDSGDRTAAAELVTGDGQLASDDAETLLDLLSRRRMSWRASSRWALSETDEQFRSLDVLDGGGSGLWFSSVDDHEAADPLLTLQPTRPGQVWRRLVGLMPTNEKRPA